MAFLNQTFVADEMPQGNNFDPLPAGNYTVTINSSELKTTKAGDGQYIKLRLDVTGPTHQGRVLFTNINVFNKNPKAEEIGRQQLGDIMRAMGLPNVNDTDQLIGGDLLVKVAIKDDPQYGPSNEVKSFKAPNGAPAASSSMPMPKAEATPPPAAAKGAAPPWAKK